MIVSFAIMILFGEFAGIIHFNFHGYQYIPGNWLTRALPYMLLGMYLREKLGSLFEIAIWKYIVLFVTGALLSVGEIILLGRLGLLVYEGHMLGYGIMAFSACGLAISNTDALSEYTSFVLYDTALSGFIYIFMDPIYYVTGLIALSENISYFSYFGGIAAFLLSILPALLLKKSIIATAFFSSHKQREYIRKNNRRQVNANDRESAKAPS